MNTMVENLWDELSRPLLRYITAKVKNTADAEDILQKVFLLIHTRLSNVHDLGKVRLWIYSITRNAVADHYRALRLHDELRDDHMAFTPDTEDEALNQDVGHCLLRMIDFLPDNDREALLFIDINGLSQKDLSEAIGISLPGAKSRVQRARRRLKKIFLDCCKIQTDRYGNIVDYDNKQENLCGRNR